MAAPNCRSALYTTRTRSALYVSHRVTIGGLGTSFAVEWSSSAVSNRRSQSSTSSSRRAPVRSVPDVDGVSVFWSIPPDSMTATATAAHTPTAASSANLSLRTTFREGETGRAGAAFDVVMLRPQNRQTIAAF
jgi:hypothetical protein